MCSSSRGGDLGFKSLQSKTKRWWGPLSRKTFKTREDDGEPLKRSNQKRSFRIEKLPLWCVWCKRTTLCVCPPVCMSGLSLKRLNRSRCTFTEL
ncbi:hypothetical protein EVAR_30991_1 [Eumeta japonica]|uniref:Uncharacterized protein n=1 Tax=Eumeta variegata TaxID=151549 RepID=A0A4C1W8V8_EUMVA|nr:hypothetical protein EVAR_30991_1 [Eumeta japonica]